MWQQGLCLVMCREALMAEWGGASMTDADLCMWRTVSGKVGRSAAGRTPPVETDWCGGGWRSVVAASFGGYSREAHLSRQVEGWPHPTVLRFNCLSRRSRCTCHNGWLRLANDPSVCMWEGKEVCQNAAWPHSPSLQLSPQIWICHTCSTHLTPYYWAAIEVPRVWLCWFKLFVPHSISDLRYLNIHTDTLLHAARTSGCRVKKRPICFLLFVCTTKIKVPKLIFPHREPNNSIYFHYTVLKIKILKVFFWSDDLCFTNNLSVISS